MGSSETSTFRVLIVVPVYNEEQSLDRVIHALAHRCDFADVLYVNDGSRDSSGSILQNLGHDVLHHPVNLGYLEALRSGIQVSLDNDYDAVAFFDGDGQHRIECLNKMICHMRQSPDCDVLVGSRYLSGERAASGLRHHVARAYSFLTGVLAGCKILDVTSGLKVLSRHACIVMQDFILEDGHAELIVNFARSGLKIVEVPISVNRREEGATMYHLSKLMMYPLRTSFLLLTALTRRQRRGV